MQVFKSNLLNHFKTIQPLLKELEATARLDALTFQLKVQFGATSYLLQPQFIEVEQGAKRYTPEFSDKARTFIGWCPYFNKRWELSNEKLKFKEYAARNGLRIPQYSTIDRADLDNVIVKRSRSSFGTTIKGPFRKARECPLDRERGEYYEKFIPGRIVKTWYWNEQAVCLEFEDSPKLVGDGVSTVERLASKRLTALGRKPENGVLERCAAYLAYQGRSLDTVLAWNETLAVDFRYGSPFRPPRAVEDVDLGASEWPALKSQLGHIGKILWNGIPGKVRQDTVFSVDAILDGGGHLWVLEMNSNPFIHPFVYPAMLRSLSERAKQNQGNPAAALITDFTDLDHPVLLEPTAETKEAA